MENSDSKLCYYFAYGSNMNVKRMTERGVNFISRELGLLQGYSLVHNKKIQSNGTAAANILPNKDSVVYGALYTCADDHVLTQLDKYEGVSNNQYYRTNAKIILSNGELCNANVYIAHADVCEEGLLIHPAYLDNLLEARDILPHYYFDFLCIFKKQLVQNVVVYYYFAYGSDMNPSEIQTRGVKYSTRELGYLPGYQICFNKVKKSSGLAAANILPCKDSKVYGAVYKCYGSDPFEQLDNSNGVKTKHYFREKLRVYLTDGQAVKANVYIAYKDACKEGLQIDQKHFDTLIEGKDILPEHYVNSLISSMHKSKQ